MTKNIGRIIVVGNSPFHAGGGGPLAHNLLGTLVSAGHRVRAIFSIQPETTVWRETFPDRYPGIPVAWYEMPFISNPFTGSLTADLQRQLEGIRIALENFLADEDADLVYLHKENTVWGVPGLAQRHGLRCLATLHGNLLAMLSGEVCVEQAQEWLERYKQVDLAVCCAKHMAVTLEASGLRNLAVAQNGVDIGQFRPVHRPEELAGQLGLSTDDVVLLHVSNLKSIKRPLDVVRGFAQALRHDKRLFLIIVGDGQMRNDLFVEAHRLGVISRVHFAGWIRNSEMPLYYALANVSVNTSASEGLSLACLESMACGCPIIASDIPGSRELMTNNIDGLLFPVGDLAALTEKILSVAGDAKRLEILGEAARRTVERSFSLQRLAPRQLQVIARLL